MTFPSTDTPNSSEKINRMLQSATLQELPGIIAYLKRVNISPSIIDFKVLSPVNLTNNNEQYQVEFFKALDAVKNWNGVTVDNLVSYIGYNYITVSDFILLCYGIGKLPQDSTSFITQINLDENTDDIIESLSSIITDISYLIDCIHLIQKLPLQYLNSIPVTTVNQYSVRFSALIEDIITLDDFNTIVSEDILHNFDEVLNMYSSSSIFNTLSILRKTLTDEERVDEFVTLLSTSIPTNIVDVVLSRVDPNSLYRHIAYNVYEQTTDDNMNFILNTEHYSTSIDSNILSDFIKRLDKTCKATLLTIITGISILSHKIIADDELSSRCYMLVSDRSEFLDLLLDKLRSSSEWITTLNRIVMMYSFYFTTSHQSSQGLRYMIYRDIIFKLKQNEYRYYIYSLMKDEVNLNVFLRFSSTLIEHHREYGDEDDYNFNLSLIELGKNVLPKESVCDICTENKNIYYLNPCLHKICGSCFIKIMDSASKCPFCRTDILSSINTSHRGLLPV